MTSRFAVATAVAALITGSFVTLAPTAAQAETVVIATTAPPPLRAEPVPPARAGYAWDPGHWRWAGGQYVWAPGHWQPMRVGYRWVPGHWTARGAGWRWMPGHWA